MDRPRSLPAALIAAMLALSSYPANAEYPDRPVTAIVPFAPGGPADIIGRILSTFMPQTLGQSVVIENRGGAAGNIGMGQATARPSRRLHFADYLDRDFGEHRAVQEPALRSDQGLRFADLSELCERAERDSVVRPISASRPILPISSRAHAKRNPTPSATQSGRGHWGSHLTGEQRLSRAASTWCTCRSAARARRHAPRAGGHPARLGCARRRRAAGSNRDFARLCRHRREALVLAAGRSDDD